MNIILSGFLIISAIFFVSNITYSYAALESDPEWELLFITSDAKCTNAEKNTMKELTSLTQQYFKEYEFDNTFIDASCMHLENYSPNSIPDDSSLLILILDGRVGDSILTKNGYESFYAHLGDDKSIKHTIIMKTNSINDLYTATPTPWLLSHQLSHYVLSYKGYNGNSIEHLLHHEKIDYTKCTGKSASNKKCNDVRTIMRPADLGKDFFIMPPYEPVVGKTIVKYLPEELLSSKITIELQREITKWWVNGIIDDSSYGKTILHIINSPTVLNSTTNDQVMVLPNGFAILDSDSTSSTTWTPGPFEAFAVSDDVSEIFSLIPFEAEEITPQENDFPQWFKLRAQLWADKKIPDKIFFDGVEALLRIGIIQQ